MNCAQAAREAKALVAEWIWQARATDKSWREPYSPADAERIAAQIGKIRDRVEEHGPSAFHRQAAARREAGARATALPPRPRGSRAR